MKPTRREASIFGVSAIDLFASALGAFVVVALVLLPYFPNTGDAPSTSAPPPDPPRPAGISPAELEALRARAERAEADLAAARRRQQALARALDEARGRAPSSRPSSPANRISPAELAALRSRAARAEAALDAAHTRERELARALDAARSSLQALPPIDLIIALDTTGSMTGEVASLREEIAGLSELLTELTENAAVGHHRLQGRLRRAAGAPCRAAPAHRPPLRAAPGGLRAVHARRVAALRPHRGRGLRRGLRAAVDADWRPDSEHRSIVLISDNPAHAHLRDRAVADARRFARRPGARHTVSTVFVDTSIMAGPGHPDAASFMQRVARAGAGQFVRADENASLSVTILRAVFDG